MSGILYVRTLGTHLYILIEGTDGELGELDFDW